MFDPDLFVGLPGRHTPLDTERKVWRHRIPLPNGGFLFSRRGRIFARCLPDMTGCIARRSTAGFPEWGKYLPPSTVWTSTPAAVVGPWGADVERILTWWNNLPPRAAESFSGASVGAWDNLCAGGCLPGTTTYCSRYFPNGRTTLAHFLAAPDDHWAEDKARCAAWAAACHRLGF